MSTKKDLGPLPHWDVSKIYPSLESPELAQAIATLKSQMAETDKFLDDHHIAKTTVSAGTGRADLGAVVGEYLDRMNANLRLFGTVRVYISTFVTTDSYNTIAKRMQSEMDPLGVQLQRQDVRFQGWLGALGAELPAALVDPRGERHAFYLQETVEQSRYLMSEAEENLAAELGVSGAAGWAKLQGTVTSQLSVPFERNGQTVKLPMPALINVMHHDPDGEVRRQAYETEIAAWDTVRETLAAALNGIKGATITLNQHRGRRDVLHAALDDNRIDQATLEAMLGAMRDSFPAFRQYLKKKAQRLGQAALPWWDLAAPLGRNERTYTWAETRELVVTQFGKFSDRLANLARRAFDDNWIDAEQRDGKRGGAFCTYLATVEESRVLCNFDGSLDQVFTVAHELGHAFHNECDRHKTPLQRQKPMTLAETASIFCETIITEAAIAQAATGEEELAILETNLIGVTQVIVDISSRFIFESAILERRAHAELSADELCDLMLQAQKETYGDGLDERYLHKYMWTWKPHYYSAGINFYNFPYAFGLLFGLGLYALYQQRGAAFVPDYENLLASTGEASAADLAARFGIDIRSKEFWAGSLKVIEKRIERYLAL